MKVYVDSAKENVNLVQSVVSASTMISSIAAEAKNYILSKFPAAYFKHVYIDTSQTINQQNMNERYNKNANKIPYPSIAITPEISLDDPIGGLQKTVHMSSPNLYLRNDINRSYKKLLVDPDSQFSIYYTSDYITTNFNFKITTNSFIQNADIAFYLKSKFQVDFFHFLNERFIQSEIPKTFMRIAADIFGYNLDNPDEMDEFRLFLINTGKLDKPIEKRTNLGTGKQCIFFSEKQNLLCLITDLDCPSSINRDAQVESEYTINFRMQVSAWLPNAFILSLSKKAFHSLNKETIEAAQNDDSLVSEGILSTITFTDSLNKKDAIHFLDSYGNEQTGILVYHEKFIYDITKSEFPEINIFELLPEKFKKIYLYGITKLNIDPTALVYINNSEGILDYQTLNMKISRDKLNGNEFTLAIYVNRALYESISEAIKQDKNFFANNYMTYVTVNINGEKKKLAVKSFKNKKEECSQAFPLRIKTAYGIGYLSLLEMEDEEDSYQVCVGYSEESKPIIKKLEIIE